MEADNGNDRDLEMGHEVMMAMAFSGLGRERSVESTTVDGGGRTTGTGRDDA
jgi:hypothetical protein